MFYNNKIIYTYLLYEFKTSLGIFSGLTLILVYLEYTLVLKWDKDIYESFKKNDKSEGQMKLNSKMSSKFLLYLAWLVAVISVQTSINQKFYPGTPFGEVFLAVTVPCIIILIFTILLIEAFPQLNKPFSNVLGYAFASFLGAENKLKNLLKDPDNLKDEDKKKNMSKYINKIYNDKMIWINDFNQKDTYEKMVQYENDGYFVSTDDDDGPENNDELNKIIAAFHNVIMSKELFAKFWWIVLLGSLVITKTAQTLQSIPQSNSNDVDMQEEEEELKEATEDVLNDNAGIM